MHTENPTDPTTKTGVTAPAGFVAAGGTAGLKPSGRPDLAMVVNQGPSDLAAVVLTSNRIQAAPVRWTREASADHHLRAVVLNSGGANACTGAPGLVDAEQMATSTAEALGCAPTQVAVCSTGLIGTRLPMDRLTAGIAELAPTLTEHGGADAAEAIMTTDTVPKQAVVHRSGWCVGGMAKGAGMLAPGLATMLVVLTTDAIVDEKSLQESLSAATHSTLDRLDSDGCMSTNDTVVLLCSGASGVEVSSEDLTDALRELCADLGQQLLHDAEGAAHDIAIEVVNAASEEDAVTVGRSIARSNLFKCAIFGGDPNWGRALAALGTTDAEFDPDAVDVSFNGVQVCRAGGVGEDRSLVDLGPRQVRVGVDLHAGQATATIWTNDLTYDYVKENAEYST